MSKNKLHHFEGNLENLPKKKIYINVNHLEKGNYELYIIHNKKLIIKTTFKKL